MHTRKKWILTLCCVFMACVMGASAIGCSFSNVNDSSSNLDAQLGKLENVTGKYDVSNLATANFNDSVTKLDTVQTEISVIIDLGGNGLYDIYNGSGSFADFAKTSAASKYVKVLTKQQNAFISALQKSGIDYTLRGSYTALLNGVALRISSADYYKLGSIEGVKHVYRNEVYAVPEAVVENNTPVYSTGVYDSSSVDQKGDGMLVAVLDTGLDYTHAAFQTMPDEATAAWDYDRVKSVFDNGLATDNGAVYLRSKELGYGVDDVYVNAKVPYAFDYADDDPDVYPSYSNHGTHVAGIIAGRDENKQVDDKGNTFIGVAPNAQLAIMKVFTDNLDSKMLGGADSVDILQAINDCAILGVDVINMSLGSAGGFSDDDSDAFVSAVYSRIQSLGISLIVAAGNEYSSGYGGGNGTNLATNPDSGTVGSPSSYEASLSVASIEGQKAPYVLGNSDSSETVAFITNSSDAYGNEMDFVDGLYAAVNNWNEQHGRDPVALNKPLTVNYVVIGGVGNTMNYTSSIRRQLRSEPTIALIKRGDISFADKVQNAMNNDAVACIIYNNLSGTIRMSLGEVKDPVPACSIGLEAGTELINNAKSGRGTVTVSKDYLAGPFMSEFSSWGPTPSLRLKPEITAYGGKIMSAIPGGYDQQSGTSMASPNMAGMVALMRQYVNKQFGLSGAELNARVYQMLMSTTTLVLNDEGNPYSPRKQGSGLGNLHAAINTKAYITVNEKDAFGNDVESAKTKIELYDDPDKTGVYELTFTVHNTSDGAVSYKPTVYNMTETLAIDLRTVAERSHMLSDTAVKIAVNGTETSSERITVPASSSVEVTVTLTLGAAGRKYIEDSFANGMYVEGFVRLEDGLDEQNEKLNELGVPYLAFYGDWAKAPMFDYDMYEISENENDTSYEWDEKIHASASATTPLGMFEDYYIIPLGSYVYTMEDTDVAIDASDERAAISIYNDDYGPTRAINEFYGVYAGLLRGAKKMDVSIVDTVTGETVYFNTLDNQRKSYAGGGSNVGSPVTLGIRPYDWDWNNNTQYELTLTGKLDWKDENGELVEPEKNTFSFKFTVDYEAPTITDYRVRFEPYKDNKETKYRIYMDVDVFDNQYSMSLLPCFLKENDDGSNTLYSITHYPLPIYSQKNEVTTVSFEITDYYEDYFKTGNFFLYPIDYAMNHSLYRVTPAEGVTYPEEITFDTSDGRLRKSIVGQEGDYKYQTYTLTLHPNEVYKLNELQVLPEGTVNHKLTWEPSIGVQAYENEIYAGPNVISSPVALTLKAGSRTVARIMVSVRENSETTFNPPRLQSISFQPVFNGDSYVSAVGMTLPLNNNTKTQLKIECTPWYYGTPAITWSSSDNNVATVDENGVVSTHSTGAAWITAETVTDGGRIVSTSVEVVVDSDYDVRNYRLYNYYGGPDVVIPERLNIMYLDDECFQENTTIRSVKLPSTLTEIPERAFYGCTSLEEIEIPASCGAILTDAFVGCTSLKKITLVPFANKVDGVETVGSLTIGLSAFANCTSLNEIVHPERMTTLGDGAFYGCTGLTSLDISGLRVAGSDVFAGCTGLTFITMSAQTKLGAQMFRGCTGLKNVTIAATSLPNRVFYGCTGLNTVTFDHAPNTTLKSIGNQAFYGCTGLTSIELPNGSYSIGSDAFGGCTKLASVKLSAQTLILGDLYTPFSSCEAFSEITVEAGNSHYSSKGGALYNADGTKLLLVPVLANVSVDDLYGSVEVIGASAFTGNQYLQSIDLTRFKEVGEYAFAETKLSSVIIPAGWTKIPDGLFYGCNNLSNVEFQADSNVKVIGADAFGSCDKLTGISLPASVKVISDGAFGDCTHLGVINLENVEEFGSYSLANTIITRIDAPNAKTLYDYAFIAMRRLSTVRLGAVTYMGESVFCDIYVNPSNNQAQLIGNSCLTSVSFADGTTKIGPYAFANSDLSSDNLIEVILPDSVNEIGAYAFINRTKITYVNLKGVQTVGAQAFFNCTSLGKGDDGSGSEAEVDLSAVENIGVAAFAFTKSLKKANLSSAMIIGGSAFESSGIDTLTIPSAAAIDAFAFAETKITTVQIPASLNQYNYVDKSFYKINDAGDLELVEGKYALSLMGGAFMYIDTLTAFTVEQGNETYFADDGVLYANVKEGKVLVQYPAGKQDAEYTVLDGTVRISDYAFYNEEHLKKITFPVSLKAIGAFAFYNDDTEGTVEREYVFTAVEAPVLESILSTTTEYINKSDENSMVLGSTLNIYSNVFYANFGNFAALIMEEDHVKSQIQWLKDQGISTSGYNYKTPVYNYVITRPENGIGYDNPVWQAYFSSEHTKLSAYAADRTTAAAIRAIQGIMSAEQIKAEIDAMTGTDADKWARLDEISVKSLTQAREAYNLIASDRQKALVTDYGKLLSAEQTVRQLKAQHGQAVSLVELRREGSYKLIYQEGEKFDPQDMKIVAVYDDGSLLELDSSTYTLDKTGALTPSDSNVTISYEGKSLVLGVYVEAKQVEVTEHTVTFAGEDVNIRQQNVNDGDKAVKPADPAREGYTFKYWYVNDVNVPFDFDTPITSDLTLTAAWEKQGTTPEQSSNVGLIVGLSVGGAVVAAGVAVLVVLLLRKKRASVKNSDADDVNKAE